MKIMRKTRLLAAFALGAAGLVLVLTVFGAIGEASGRDERDPRWARPIDLPPVENLHQVAPGLYRSAQPTAEAFQALEKLGLVTIINIRENHSDAALIQGTNLRLVEVPVNTWSVGDEEVIAVMRLIKNEPRPILLHCKHGADRTGLMMAVYRIIFEGWTRRDALAELTGGGYGYHKIWTNIPKYIETFDQGKIERAVLFDD